MTSDTIASISGGATVSTNLALTMVRTSARFFVDDTTLLSIQRGDSGGAGDWRLARNPEPSGHERTPRWATSMASALASELVDERDALEHDAVRARVE